MFKIQIHDRLDSWPFQNAVEENESISQEIIAQWPKEGKLKKI